MNECKECIYYDDTLTFPGTGYCTLEKIYVKENDFCYDFDDDEGQADGK